MIENIIRHYCKKYKLDNKLTKQLLKISHIISILIKLIIELAGCFKLASYTENWYYNDIMNDNSAPLIMSESNYNSVRGALFLIILILGMLGITLVIDLLDLVLWWELDTVEMIAVSLTSLLSLMLVATIYTDTSIAIIFLASIIEPLIYVMIFTLLYRKFQYNKKIYYRLQSK
jgi:hypothetical protein